MRQPLSEETYFTEDGTRVTVAPYVTDEPEVAAAWVAMLEAMERREEAAAWAIASTSRLPASSPYAATVPVASAKSHAR